MLVLKFFVFFEQFFRKKKTIFDNMYKFLQRELLKTAAHYFKVVGESAAECDTIIGRQSMASAYFLRQQYEEVLVYLDSIKVIASQID